jgi:hypothetical protein
MRRLLVALICLVLIATVFAGCFSKALPPVTLVSQGATRGGEQCAAIAWRLASGETCHEVRVQLENSSPRSDAETHAMWWSAADAEGAVFDAADAAGPNRVAPGGSATLTLLFHVPEEIQIHEVRYGHRFAGAPATARISPY